MQGHLKRFPIPAIIVAGLCLLLPKPIASQDNYDPFGDPALKRKGPVHVRIRFKMIEVPQEDFQRIVNRTSAPKERLYTSVQKLVKNEQAKLVHEAVLIGRSGERATLTSIREVIYPSDYEPPGGYYPLGSVPLKAPIPFLPFLRPSGVPPNTFETRNCGDTLEIEPLIGQNMRTVDLRFNHDQVSLARFTTWLTHRDRWGEANLFHPEFETYRVNMALTLHTNQPEFCTTYIPKNPKGQPDPSRIIMVFVEARVIRP